MYPESEASDTDEDEEHVQASLDDRRANASSLDSKQVVRRMLLPSGPVGDEGSLFAVLKKNIGKVWLSL